MLRPDTRHLLTDALRPPAGYHLDLAVATTYSLDLTSLILAPLAMAAHDAASISGDSEPDPIALLESVRRYAKRTTVFCHAGAIHVPPNYRPILGFAEDSVVQVVPSAPNRVFHPKIWILRFENAKGELRHRFLCLSRNLTMDRSWDTVLQMDEAHDATGAGADPIADFLLDLPSLAATTPDAARKEQITSLAASLRSTTFEVPDPFRSAEFWPMGTPSGRDWPFPTAAKSVVTISPFMDASCLRRLPRPHGSRLVSRAETFDRLGGHAIPDGLSTWVLQRAAETDDPDEPAADGHLEVSSGLHAKTFVWDIDKTGYVLTGSANATGAAFGGNVEFSVLLSGPVSSCGTAPLLTDDSQDKSGPGLSKLIQPYEVLSPDPVPDPAYTSERAIEAFHAELATREIIIAASPEGTDYTLTITLPEVAPPVGSATTVRPLGRMGQGLASDGALVWRGVAEKNISPFVVLETTLATEGVTVRRACVVKGSLVGDPEDRHKKILRSLLANEADILRYLALLLGDPAFDTLIARLQDETTGEGSQDRHPTGSRADDIVVLEPLMRAAARRDGSLGRVDSVLKELADPKGEVPHLSPAFLKLWSIVWAATKEMQK